MMNQSMTDHPQTFPPPMATYIPPSVPPISTLNPHPQQQQQQIAPLVTPEQPSLVQYPPTAVAATPAAANSSDAELSTTNFNAQQQQQQQQQQMAAMMQMQQQWAAAGYTAPFMMQYPPAMMMMPPQPGMDRPASRQSSRPPSRQSMNAPVSSSRSMTNGQTGGQTPALPQGMLPSQGYPGYLPPGMYNPWFDPYWQSLYASYQNPYSFGYSDEMMKYWRPNTQTEDDRYSHHSAAQSQSKQSQHSSSMHTWGSIDSLNDPYYQNQNVLLNGYYPSTQQQPIQNQSKRPTKTTADPNKLLTTAPIPTNQQQIPSTESKTKPINAPHNGADEEDDEEDDEDDDDDDDESQEESDDASSDRFSIKSDLAQINEETSKARQTPLFYSRPHLRAKFSFDQLLQVLPQSPSDTSQPATVEIISSNAIHSIAPSLVEERQLLSDFIGPLTSSTAKSNVIRYCERQSQLANKAYNIIDRDALSILWQYMALLIKTNGVINIRVDIPKLLWSSSNTPIIDESNSNSNNTLTSSTTTLENSLREFLALGEIDTSIKFACENQLYTHALIISYLTDRQFFEKTIHNIISNLDNGDVLKTFYELGAGSTPSVVSNVTKPHYGDWKRHLAVILANRTDTNADFVDLCVKTMGDTLITSGRVYAAHFCYLIANVPFGSYRNNVDKLAVLGSIHAGQSNLSFATIPNLQLTEVYEYALRKCLTAFIPLKIYYTSKLVLHGLKREALAYCEEIGHTLIKQGNTAYVQLVDLQLFILIAEKSRAFSRNFQLDPTSYKEPTWLIELRRIIQSLIDNAFLNKTVRDESLNSSQSQQTNLSTYPNNQITNIHQQTEQTVTTTIPSVSYPPTTNTSNGYNPTNQYPTEQVSYSHSAAANNYQNNLQVDTNIHYPAQAQTNFYQPPTQQQPQQQPPQQTYYPPDSQQIETTNYSQQWSQQQSTIQPDLLNASSQLAPNNTSYYQPPSDQSSYIQPGFTSTPNPYSSQQQQQQQQQWYPSGQTEQRERLPSTEQQQQLDSMRRRSSIITFDQNVNTSSNWQQPSMTDNRKTSSTSTQSNTTNNSPKNTSDTTNFVYQPPQLMRYPTNQTSTNNEESQQQQQQTNGQVKKKHAIFDDGDDVFPNNSSKPTDANSKTTPTSTANQTAAGGQKSGIVGSLFNRLGWKRPTQAHLPDDKNRTLKYDQQTGRWIDTAKSADEQASTQIKPPPIMSTTNTSSSSVNNSQQQSQVPQQQQQLTSSTFNPSMPPGSSQPRTLSFAAGSTTTIVPNNTVPPQTTAVAYPPQLNTTPAHTATQSQTQQQQQQPQQQPQQQQPQQQQQQQAKAPAQLSAAQQRLQAMRQQQQQQQAVAMQQTQPPTNASSNQYSLRSRPTQARYVDVLASTKGAVAPTPNISLNDLIPTPSAGVPTFAPSNQANNYFVPGSAQSTTGSHDQSSSS